MTSLIGSVLTTIVTTDLIGSLLTTLVTTATIGSVLTTFVTTALIGSVLITIVMKTLDWFYINHHCNESSNWFEQIGYLIIWFTANGTVLCVLTKQ